MSPDRSFIVSASGDKTLKAWGAASGRERATLPLLGQVRCVAVDPCRTHFACGDEGGSVHVVVLKGLSYGPIIVAATDFGEGPQARCPACGDWLAVDRAWLGQEIACPLAGFDAQMRINPFITTIHPLPPAAGPFGPGVTALCP